MLSVPYPTKVGDYPEKDKSHFMVLRDKGGILSKKLSEDNLNGLLA